jgi:hypothetical protein
MPRRPRVHLDHVPLHIVQCAHDHLAGPPLRAVHQLHLATHRHALTQTFDPTDVKQEAAGFADLIIGTLGKEKII